jgi:two-component system chemotaxis response regulator CheY
MKFLIVDDDNISRKFLKGLLSPFGKSDTAENGMKAIEAFKKALEYNEPYDLICMDIMMPELDGQEALKQIRLIEKVKDKTAVKVIMITAVSDVKHIMEAYNKGKATSYIVKPVQKKKLYEELYYLSIITKEQLNKYVYSEDFKVIKDGKNIILLKEDEEQI